MSFSQTLRRAAGAPARRFLDQRFDRVERHTAEALTTAQADADRMRQDLDETLNRHLDRMAFELAAASREHLESISYVAAELARLEAGVRGEVAALRADLHTARAAGDGGLAVHAFALRALAGLEAGAPILIVGDEAELIALSLDALGHRVTLIAAESTASAHPPVNVTADPFHAPEAYAGLVAIGDAAALHDAVERYAELLAPGGLAVLRADSDHAAAPPGLSVVFRASLVEADGAWMIDGHARDGVPLLCARRD